SPPGSWRGLHSGGPPRRRLRGSGLASVRAFVPSLFRRGVDPLLLGFGAPRQKGSCRQRAVGGWFLLRAGLDDRFLRADAVAVIVQLSMLRGHALVGGEPRLDLLERAPVRLQHRDLAVLV